MAYILFFFVRCFIVEPDLSEIILGYLVTIFGAIYIVLMYLGAFVMLGGFIYGFYDEFKRGLTSDKTKHPRDTNQPGKQPDGI